MKKYKWGWSGEGSKLLKVIRCLLNTINHNQTWDYLRTWRGDGHSIWCLSETSDNLSNIPKKLPEIYESLKKKFWFFV